MWQIWLPGAWGNITRNFHVFSIKLATILASFPGAIYQDAT